MQGVGHNVFVQDQIGSTEVASWLILRKASEARGVYQRLLAVESSWIEISSLLLLCKEISSSSLATSRSAALREEVFFEVARVCRMLDCSACKVCISA